MSKTTMRILLLVLMLLALEGASAQGVQPVLRDQEPKPAASTESATSKFFDGVKAGDVDLVRRLLEQNPALISVRTEFAWAPLHVAGRTPLHAAVKDDTTEVAEFLLSRNANVNAKDNEGNTPLHVQLQPDESREWIKETTELLLANKADVNAKNGEGLTPLMIAIKAKSKGAIELIRKHEAK